MEGVYIMHDFDELTCLYAPVMHKLDFISPENIHEWICQTGELRSLPRNHQAKEDKLEVCLLPTIAYFLVLP